MLSGSRANALQFLERRKRERGGMARGMPLREWHVREAETQPRWKTLDEARNLFVERPQLRRGKMRTSQRREFSIGGGRTKLQAFPFSFLIFEIGVLDIYFTGETKDPIRIPFLVFIA